MTKFRAELITRVQPIAKVCNIIKWFWVPDVDVSVDQGNDNDLPDDYVPGQVNILNSIAARNFSTPWTTGGTGRGFEDQGHCEC